jgi:hypothetical protein
MSTHTQGPWKVTHPIQDADADRYIWTQTNPATGHRELIAIIPDAEGDHVSADARLIATAPELLDALQGLMEYVGGWDAAADHPCGKARDAIQKATGV